MAVIHPPFPPVPDALPPGRVVDAAEGMTDARWAGRPVLWITADPVPDAAALWTRLYDERAKTGLYPLLLPGLRNAEERPWLSGELGFAPVDAVDALDAATALDDLAWDDGDEGVVAPRALAAPGVVTEDPDALAVEVVAILAGGTARRVGLVPVDRGADALAMSGWDGPCNHTNDTEKIAAVVRSWEERFGARVVQVGFDTLEVSVAAPPTTIEHARAVAAEHYIFCPDNVDQGVGSLDEYAADLVGAPCWSFWWD
ncbi:DUF4253 domain-containing protein [Actinomadura atramentaria]|uniref:DUF4253 domain-containing protein n=1 Tax=Actinomadura atramentaria TaxID=1990 RepID=UPI0003A5C2D5|nr:DUF4253 domain-containing protein [Actinomadura atramentaria]